MSKRTLLSILFLASLVPADAQKIWEQRKGCFRAQGNLAGGYLFQQRAPSAYVVGDMDLFFDERVSLTGSIWISFATNRRNQTGIKMNHAVFGGASYHFINKSRWDPYLGFTPGLGVVQVAYNGAEGIKRTPLTPVPLLSAVAGVNYYIGWFFHFFVKVQGVSGQAFSTLPTPARLEELKVTGGLGWNVRFWKPKNRTANM